MTKKEKLINWAREKFERDPNGKILLIAQYILDDGLDRWYLEKGSTTIKNLDDLTIFLKSYDDNLIEDLFTVKFDCCSEEFDIFIEKLKRTMVEIDDAHIDSIYWQSSEDRKILEEN